MTSRRHNLISAADSPADQAASPRSSSPRSPSAGWRTLIALHHRIENSLVGDAIGVIALFFILFAGLFIGELYR